MAISLAHRRQVSPQRLWPALRQAGGIEPLLGLSQEELTGLLGSGERARSLLSASDDREADRWAWEIERGGIQLLTAFDSKYPPALSEISDPPFVLFAIGDLERLKLPAVAVVGSRNATRYGLDVATSISRDLSASGVTVVSGFARGVDGAAHAAALEGAGGTVAVLGCGLDINYPREHARLKDSVARRGLLLSELPPGTGPEAHHFPIRNRIIAGLSAGVVVVEASRRSGSLITARLANDAGRDVFAVPGSVFSATSSGAHELLRDGAILCRDARDVLAELFPTIGSPALSSAVKRPSADLSVTARAVLEILRSEQDASAEEIAQATDLPAAAVLASLFELEEAGLAVFGEGGRYGLTRRE